VSTIIYKQQNRGRSHLKPIEMLKFNQIFA